jgi:deoxycytidylate deaminase
MRINEKFCKKWLRLAKQIAEDENPCYSRHIGCVIVNPITNKLKGTGYNGPPAKTPHPDDPEYLRNVVWPQLTESEKQSAVECARVNGIPCRVMDEDHFVFSFAHRRICPRRIIGAPSGSRLELCSCEHGEKNAIYNACEEIDGCWIFCWCGVPCWDCCKAIINAGLSKVVCLSVDGPDYSLGSRWLLKNAGVALEIRDPVTLEVITSV